MSGTQQGMMTRMGIRAADRRRVAIKGWIFERQRNYVIGTAVKELKEKG